MHSKNLSPIAHLARINGLDITYYTAGKPGNPTLVFLHGWGTHRHDFAIWKGTESIIQELSQHFYVIAPELPGLIESETPKTPRGYEEYARMIHELLHAQGASTSFLLLGNSFGGLIALLYTKLYPEDVRQLVLVSSVLSFQPMPNQPTLLRWAGTMLHTILLSPAIPSIIKKVAVTIGYGTPLASITDQVIQRKMSMQNPMFYVYDMDYELIHVPTLLIWGDKDKRIPIEQAKKVSHALPNATIVTLKGSHVIFSRKPSEVIASIQNFLDHH